MSADVMEDQPLQKKQKLASSVSMDDELDGFSELNQLEDIKQQNAPAMNGGIGGSHQSQPMQQMHMASQQQQQSAQKQQQPGPGQMFHGGSGQPSQQQQPPQHQQQQQPPAQQQPPQQQQQPGQPSSSVLQELLMSNTHSTASSMNSPRPSYTSFNTRSPMSGNVGQQNITPPSNMAMHGSQQPRAIMRQHAAAVAAANNQQPVYDSAGGMGPPAGLVGSAGGPPYHMMSGQPQQGGGPPYGAPGGPFNPQQQHQQQMHMRQLYGQQGGSAVRGGPGSVPGQQMPPHAGSPMNRATPNAMIANGGGPTPQGRQIRPPYSNMVMSGGQPQPRSMMMQQVPGGVMPAAYDQYGGHVMGNGPAGGPHRQAGMPPDGYASMQTGSNGGSGGPVGQMMPGHMQQPNSSQPGMRGFPPGANGPNGPPSGMINAQMAGHRQAGGYVGISPSSIPSQMMSHGIDSSMIGSQSNIHQMPSQGMMMNGPSHMGPGGSQQPSQQQVKGMMNAMGQPGPQQSLAPSPGAMGGGMSGQQHPAGMMQQPGMMNGPGSMRGPGGGMPAGMGGRGGPPGSTGPPSAQQSQDPEKRKLIQQQLVLLLHAHKCQQREKQEPPNRDPANSCSVPYCSLMKSVLEHMTSCGNGRQCEYQHCASSRQIITHWKNCSKDDCPVCKPVKNFNSMPSGDRRQDMMGGSMSMLGTPHAMSVGSVDLGAPFTSPPPPSSSSNAAVNNLLNDYTPNLKSNPFQSANPPNKIGQPNSIPPIQSNLSQDAGFGQFPPPEPPAQPKEWHDSITQDLRNHLVGKLVKAIFPSPDPAVIHDQRIKDLISYARKVEKDMFEQAADKEAYYHLLAEKIYKIQKELQEKKNRRLNEQNQNVGGGPMDTGLGDFPPVRHVMGGGPSDFGPMAHAGPVGMGSGDFPGVSAGSNGAGMMNAGGMLMKDVKAEPMIHHPSQQQQSGAGASSSAMGGMKDVKIEPLSHPHQQPMLGGGTSGVNGLSVAESITSMSSTSLNFVPKTAGAGVPSLTKMKSEEKCMAIAGISGESLKSELLDEPASSKALVLKTDATPVAQVEEDLPVDEKVFSPNELRNYLKPVHQKVWDPDEAAPFRYPVDAEQLGIPDYYNIINNPMDLTTIDKKLNNGDYKNPWEFCEDMYLMFENAWLYNRKNSKVYKCCTKLSELFIAEINPVMREMGYCCGQKLSFTPLALFCYGQSACVIARDQPYHLFESNSNNYGVVVNDRLIYCTKCFEALPDEGINLNENPNEAPNMAPKQNFKLLKNDQIDMEPFEKCKICMRQWHRICANYSKKIFPEGFICETCRTAKGRPKPENRFTAKRLPHCQLSRFIEERVNSFIEGRCEPGARDKSEVVIRVLCSTDKEVEVKPMMKQKYCSENFPERFPYRTKAVFAFEVVDGVEVCFFGLHVQEYGSSCTPPNQRRVYIAYLDSVYFFQPKHLRTDIYHEILLGYLSYVKKLGYTMAHIWACPPSEGDDYIFHCHPPEQKIPKQKRLQEWYKKMLDKGRDEDTVYEYKDIFKQAKDDDLQTPMTLPYFEGDFWPNVIEDCIRDAEKEENERKKHEELLVEDEEDDTFQMDDGRSKKNNNKSSNSKKKNNLKKSSQKNKKKSGPGTGNQITDKLFSVLEKHKEVFFTIRLVSPNVELKVKATSIHDPDPLMASELMDGRDTFLNKAREEHWEFSSLRRAKWSTINFCHALHTLEQDKEILTCNVCSNAAADYHCNTCEDYDLCQQCYNTAAADHPHKLDKVQSDTKATSSGSDSSVNDRNESVKRCISSLVHSCQCRDANCRRLTCHKMKRVVQHTRVCRKRQQTNCPVCKQLIALCCYHAKHCNQSSCLVPFCTNIRQKLQEQKRSQTRRADKLMRRRMEMLHTNNAAASSTSTSNSHQSADNGGGGDRNPPSSSSNMNGMQKPGGSGGGTGMMAHQQPMPTPQRHPSAHQHHGGGGGYQLQHHHPAQQPQHHGGAAHSHAGMMMAGDQSPMNNGQPPQQSTGGISIHQQQQLQHMGGGNASMMHGGGGMGNGAMMGHYQSPGGPMSQHQMSGPMTPQQQQMRNAQMMQGHMGMNPQQRMAGSQQPSQMMSGPMNPPPYGGRGGGMVNSPAGPYSNQTPGGPGSIPPQQQQQAGMRMPPQQMQRSMQSPQQQQQQQQRHLQRPQQIPPQQQQQHQQQQQPLPRLSESQMHQITERLKNADSTEKRAAVFTDLKKTPHLFAAVVKLKEGFIKELFQQYMQDQNQHQSWVSPQYSQQQQMQMGGEPPPYNNNNNNSGHQQQESQQQQQQQQQWSSVKFSQ